VLQRQRELRKRARSDVEGALALRRPVDEERDRKFPDALEETRLDPRLPVCEVRERRRCVGVQARVKPNAGERQRA